MKHNKIYRVSALIMAFLMFFTSIGYSVDLHFCEGKLKSFSILGEASNCHATKSHCPRHIKSVQDKDTESNCCSNKTVEIEDLDTDYNFMPQVELTNLQAKIVVSFVLSFSNTPAPKVVKSTFQKNTDFTYPLDIYVLFQRFLI